MTDGVAERSPEGAAAPDRPHGSRSTPLLAVAAAAGVVATTTLVLVGARLGSGLPQDHLWFVEPLLDTGVRRTRVLYLGALALLVAAWLLLGVAVRRDPPRLRVLLGVAALWSVPLVLGPPLFSPDAYLYTAVAASMGHGVDPYVNGPGVLGDLPAVRGSEPFWRFLPSPYGPLFLDLTAAVSSWLDERLLPVLVALRALSLAAFAVVVVAVVRLTGLARGDRARALWVAVANPVVLLSVVSGNHNDVLMMTLLALGVLLAVRGHPLLGILACVLAGGIKVVALAAVAVIVADVALRRTGWRQRGAALLGAGVLALGAFVLTVVLAGRGWGWLRTLSVPARVEQPLSPPTALAYLLDPSDPPVDLARTLALGLGALAGAALLTRLPSWGLLRVSGAVMTVVLVVSPVVWAWYLLWPLVLLAPVVRWHGARVLAVASALVLFTTEPGGRPTLTDLGRPLADGLVLAVLAALALWAALPTLQARRRGAVAAA